MVRSLLESLCPLYGAVTLDEFFGFEVLDVIEVNIGQVLFVLVKFKKKVFKPSSILINL